MHNKNNTSLQDKVEQKTCQTEQKRKPTRTKKMKQNMRTTMSNNKNKLEQQTHQGQVKLEQKHVIIPNYTPNST